MSRVFGLYGELCAKHQWEVIVAVITLTTCLNTMDKQHEIVHPSQGRHCDGCSEESSSSNASHMIVMTIVRCAAILYSYHQFRHLQRLGSKYILGIAGVLTVVSSLVFTTTVLNILQIELVDLKDAMFCFLLLIDLSKAATLAQFALTAASQEDISRQIARGMSVLGPNLTLDTIVETLVIGVGTMSGAHRLEIVSYIACLSAIVNYVIFMTFYPACLSLMLELGRTTYNEHQTIKVQSLEEHEKSNPATQRVKIIMSAGLLVVHICSRWTFQTEPADADILNKISANSEIHCSEDNSYYAYFLKKFALSADHIVILILLITLIVKFVFFETREQFTYHLHQEELDKRTTLVPQEEGRRSKVSISNTESQTDFNFLENIQSPPMNDDLLCTRTLEDCLQIYRSDSDAHSLNDKEVLLLVDTKHIPSYNLEKAVKNPERGVRIRRKLVENTSTKNVHLELLPYQGYDYSKVMGACCENVVGYIPVPVGVAGPLLLDGKAFFVPMSTTEGCLVASTNRGCRAVEKSGIKSRIVGDGMTRAPIVRFASIAKASEVMSWLKVTKNLNQIKASFNSTSRFAKLSRITTHIAGRYLFIRFVAETGDAMGMNMLSKGTEQALTRIQREFPEMEILSLSGNVCTDKKPAAINWIEGRGKSVVCEAVVSADVVSSVLKTNTHTLVDLNISKNLIGSAMAGSIGGFNAHAANIVTAIFIATGQDPAQTVGSSNCITILEPWGENGQDLYITCSMPSIEIGTIGGGTILPAQSTCLEMLGVKGPHADSPGDNAKQLAKIVCATVLAGELSLMAALASGHLVKSHLRYNRSYSSKDGDCVISNEENQV